MIDYTLLIDDDKATNFYHKLILNKHESFNQVIVTFNGEEAINYLEQAKQGVKPKPGIIFLDLNMPKMNGWEFMDRIVSFGKKWFNNIKIVILSTSQDPEDLNKAKENFLIQDYINKPLSINVLDEIIQRHFKWNT